MHIYHGRTNYSLHAGIAFGPRGVEVELTKDVSSVYLVAAGFHLGAYGARLWLEVRRWNFDFRLYFREWE